MQKKTTSNEESVITECKSLSIVIPDLLMDSFHCLRNLASIFSAAIARALRRKYLLFSGVLRYKNGVRLDVDMNFDDWSVLLFQRLYADLRGDLYSSTHDGHFGPCDSISHD